MYPEILTLACQVHSGTTCSRVHLRGLLLYYTWYTLGDTITGEIPGELGVLADWQYRSGVLADWQYPGGVRGVLAIWQCSGEVLGVLADWQYPGGILGVLASWQCHVHYVLVAGSVLGLAYTSVLGSTLKCWSWCMQERWEYWQAGSLMYTAVPGRLAFSEIIPRRDAADVCSEVLILMLVMD